MGIPDLSGGILRDPMLEVKAYSEGIRQQQQVGTTFSNAVKGFEEGQDIAAKGNDITNQQQMIAQNEINLQKQQEELQYYPQKLAIENAERTINFANKTSQYDIGVMTGLVGADSAIKIMNINRAARVQTEQFLQADPVQKTTLLTSPDFRRTVAQSPQLQEAILPDLNLEIQKREAAGDVVGVRELNALYGHLPGVYVPQMATKTAGVKTEAQLKAEKEAQDKLDSEDYKRGTALLTPEELADAQTQGTAGITELGRKARLKEQGNGNANLATPAQSSTTPTSSTIPAATDPATNPNKVTPSTDPTATPTESPDPANADTIVNATPRVGADSSGTNTIVRQSTKPKNVPTYKPNPNYSTLADNTAVVNAQLQDAGEIPGSDSYKAAVDAAKASTKEQLKNTAEDIQKLDTTRQKRGAFVEGMEPLIAEIEADSEASGLLGKSMEGGRDITSALQYILGAAGSAGSKAKIVDLFERLKGMSAQGLMDSGLKATQLNTEGEIRFWMSSGFTTNFGLDTLKQKLNVLKTNLHESDIASSAFHFAQRNLNANASIPALTRDYLQYEKARKLQLEERAAKGLPAISPDEAQFEGVMSPDEYFNSRANKEHALRRDASVEILQRKQRELNDSSRIDAHQSPVNGVEDTDISKIKFSPEHEEHAKVLARVDPVAYHDLYVQNSKGNAQMAAFGSASEVIHAATKLDDLKAEGIFNSKHLDALDKAGIKIDLTTAAFQAPELLRLAAIESAGNSKAVSPKKNSADMGYEGIGQLGRRAIIDGFQDFTLTHKGRDANHLTIDDITDIRGDKTSSLIAMSAFLNGRWSKQYPDKIARLAYYNGGAPQANAYMRRKNINDIPSKETRNYLKLAVGENHFTPKTIPTVQNIDYQPNEEAKTALATDPATETGDTVIGRFNKEHQAQWAAQDAAAASPVKQDSNLSPHDQLVKNKREAKQAPSPLDAIYGQTNDQLLNPENPIYKHALLPDPRNLEFPVSSDADKRKQATAIAHERMVEEAMKQGYDHPVATFFTSMNLSALNMAALGGGDKFLAALVSKGDLLHPGDYQLSYNMIKEMHDLYNTSSLSGYVGARLGDVAGMLISTPGLAVAGVKSLAGGAMALGEKIAPTITAEVASGAEQIAKMGIQYLNKHGAPAAARLFENLTIGAGKNAAQREIIKRTMADRAIPVGKGAGWGAGAGAASAEPGHEMGGAAIGAVGGAGLATAIEALPAASGFVRNLTSPSAAKAIATDSQKLGVQSGTLDEVVKGIEPGSLPSDIGDNRIGAMAAKANQAAVASDSISQTATDRLASQGQEGVDAVTAAAERAPEQILKESGNAAKILADEVTSKTPSIPAAPIEPQPFDAGTTDKELAQLVQSKLNIAPDEATKVMQSGKEQAVQMLSDATGIEYAGKNPYQVQQAVNKKFTPLYAPFKKMPVEESQIAAVVGDHPILPEVLDKMNQGKLPTNLKELLNVQKGLEEIRSNRWRGNASTVIPAEQADQALEGVNALIKKVDPEGLSAEVSNQYRIQLQADARYNKIFASTAPAEKLPIKKATQTQSDLGKQQATEIGLPLNKIEEIASHQNTAASALSIYKTLSKNGGKITDAMHPELEKLLSPEDFATVKQYTEKAQTKAQEAKAAFAAEKTVYGEKVAKTENLQGIASKIEGKGASTATDLEKTITSNTDSAASIRKALDDAGVEYGTKVESQKGFNALADLNKKLSATSKSSPVDVGQVIRDLKDPEVKAIKNIIGEDAFKGMQTAADHLSNRAKTNQLLANPGGEINTTTGEKLPWQLLSNPITAKFYSFSALLKDINFSPTAKRQLAEAFFSGDIPKMKSTWEAAAKLLKNREESIKLQKLFSSITGDLAARGVQTFLNSDKKKN